MGAAGRLASTVRRSSMTDTGLAPCLFPSAQHPSSSDGATHTWGGPPTYERNVENPGDRTSQHPIEKVIKPNHHRDTVLSEKKGQTKPGDP